MFCFELTGKLGAPFAPEISCQSISEYDDTSARCLNFAFLS